MRLPRFGIRSILVLATLVALSMFGFLERQRYLREHVFVAVLDNATWAPLTEFQYRTKTISKDSDIYVEWSDWKVYRGDGTLTLRVPTFCKLSIEAQAIGFPQADSHNGPFSDSLTTLIVPDASHELFLRVTNSIKVTGLVVDDETGQPIADAILAPGSSFLTSDRFRTDSSGRFELFVEQANESIAIYHPDYNYQFATGEGTRTVRLKRGRLVHGKVIDKDTKLPIPDCIVEVDYGQEVPWTQSSILPDTTTIDDGTVSMLRHLKLPRTTSTDTEGNFEFHIEPLAINTRIGFRREGWRKTTMPASDAGIAQVELSRDKLELSGRVIDEQGKPVTTFRVTVKYDGWSQRNRKEYQFNDPDGLFEINDSNSIVGYTVQAENYATQVHGNRLRSAGADSPFLNETITLHKGHTLAGRISGITAQTRDVEICLTNLRSCESIQDAGSQRLKESYLAPEERSQRKDLVVQLVTQPAADGSYEFANLEDGVYALLVNYKDQDAAFRPVVIENADLRLPEIQLPGVGTLRGQVKVRDQAGGPGFSPLTDANVDPFGVYVLARDGSPFGKPFRTDHQGDFLIEGVLAGHGLVEIALVSSVDREGDPEVVGFHYDVRADCVTTSNPDSVVLLEFTAPASTNPFFDLDANTGWIRGKTEAKVWLERDTKPTFDGQYKWRVWGHNKLPTGPYTLELGDGPLSVWLDFEFRINRPPEQKRLVVRNVSAVLKQAYSGSWGGAKALVLCKGKAKSATYLRFDSSIPQICYGEESLGLCDVLFYDPSNGWAARKDVSFAGKHIGLGGVEWQAGGTIAIDLSLRDLDVFPDLAVIRHRQTGHEIKEQLLGYYCHERKLEFKNVQPGIWDIEISFTDPIAGRRILHTKQVEVKATATEPVQMLDSNRSNGFDPIEALRNKVDAPKHGAKNRSLEGP